MMPIQLDRRFLTRTPDYAGDPDYESFFTTRDGLGWSGLLTRQRVVILAEGGSGKSTELRAQAAALTASGKFAVFAELQSVGLKGLRAAMDPDGRMQFDQWLNTTEPGWFFLDSVDEAKLRDIPFEEVVYEISVALKDALNRAHIVISGRHTQWNFRRDLELINKYLPCPVPDTQTRGDPDELLRKALRHELEKDVPPVPESVTIVTLTALNHAQVAKFAQALGVSDAQPLLTAIDKANLWGLSRRPVDVEWIVEYWRKFKKLGSLKEMLELGLHERLGHRGESENRRRKGTIDPKTLWGAMERVGAALVFGRMEEVAIDVEPEHTFPVVRLEVLLPELSQAHLQHLISRPIFDPARGGFARLHNDNNALVRSFLTAKWLLRLLNGNLSAIRVRDLLFSNTYGTKQVVPSLRSVAAWLALWRGDIAAKIIEIDPFVLMNEGDPGSLDLVMKKKVLGEIVRRLLLEPNQNAVSRDGLAKFSKPDLAVTVRGLWKKHSSSVEVRELLLLVIKYGDIDGCRDIAVARALRSSVDQTSLYAGEALLSVGTSADLSKYADFITKNVKKCRDYQIWEAVKELFPQHLSARSLSSILASLATNSLRPIERYASDIAEKLSNRVAAEQLLKELLHRLPKPADKPRRREDDPFVPLLEAVGRRLLELTPSREGSDLALRVAFRSSNLERRGIRPRQGEDAPSFYTLLLSSPERRRAALWWATENLKRESFFQGQGIVDSWRIEVFGFPIGLTRDDLPWLLEDIRTQKIADNRQVAASAVARLVEGVNSPEFDSLEKLAKQFPELQSIVSERRHPAGPSAEYLAHMREMERLQKNRDEEESKRDASWIKLRSDLQKNPEILRRAPARPTQIPSSVYHLWNFWRELPGNRDKYALCDLGSLTEIFGQPVVDAFLDGMDRLWRHRKPTLRVTRPVGERNIVNNYDLIGVAAVTLLANRNKTWSVGISADEAKTAAALATLELNGYPSWFEDLAKSHPDQVREVILAACSEEMGNPSNEGEFRELLDIADGPPVLSELLAPHLFAMLQRRTNLNPRFLRSAIRIIVKGMPSDPRVGALFAKRCEASHRNQNISLYMVGLLQVTPTTALSTLENALARLSPLDQTQLVMQILPSLAGSGRRRNSALLPDPTLEQLEKLVRLSYKAVRLVEDNDHSKGEVYSPNLRDDAEDARSQLFNRLVQTPGLATFKAIERLARENDLGISRQVLKQCAINRAQLDSESEAWTESDVSCFETNAAALPRTSRALLQLLQQILDDQQHLLVNADMEQGKTLANLEGEAEVQKWIGDRLQLLKGESFSVDREVEVAGKKMPDLRLRAKNTSAHLPVEIKIAESWTLDELEHALRVQLVKQYLRERDNLHGVLLLVHQKRRTKGWRRGSKVLTFPQLVAHLSKCAETIAGKEQFSPQPAIGVLDVSQFRSHRLKPARKSSVKSAAQAKIARKAVKAKPARKKPVYKGTAKVKSKKVVRPSTGKSAMKTKHAGNRARGVG